MDVTARKFNGANPYGFFSKHSEQVGVEASATHSRREKRPKCEMERPMSVGSQLTPG
jgi:hypothetical protein